MTTFEHRLDGCPPIPLGGYLKVLGVLRLIVEHGESGESDAPGGPAGDPDAQGYWHGERFVLRTALDQAALLGFFCHAYRPTPVIAPWNGGSGFWPKDNQKAINILQNTMDPRFQTCRLALDVTREQIAAAGLTEAPEKQAKARLIAALRGRLPDIACRWLDGALALTAEGPRYPPLLGTGGNDGRLEFSNNFMQRLIDVIGPAAETGERSASQALLHAALFGTACPHLIKGAVGQFAPGQAGGPNAGVGFEAESRVNPWDFILTVEGALLFAAAAVRRHATDRTAAFSYPFTIRATGAGSGAASLSDESNAHAEFWAPLWERPAGLAEVTQLMTEGRAVVGNRAARDGLDFARATAQLGVTRGIRAFQRHGFLMRSGKAYFATPLGRVEVQTRENPQALLISALEAGDWLNNVRKAVRDAKAPAGLKALGQRLDHALFGLTGAVDPRAVQEAIITVGAIANFVGRRPKLAKDISPPPMLSADWATSANDDSAEFALAWALASLDTAARPKAEPVSGSETGAEDSSGRNDAGARRLPFRCHLVPLTVSGNNNQWSIDSTEAEALAVWRGRNLAADLAAVVERRLIEAGRRTFYHHGRLELPLRGRRFAPLAAVATFLAGRTDESRIAALAMGLAWVRCPAGRTTATSDGSVLRKDVIPLAYAILKPLFDPRGIDPGEPEAQDGAEQRLIDPLPLVRLLRAGRVPEALERGYRIARGAGLPTPFDRPATAVGHAGAARAKGRPVAPTPDRLTAALAFPISREACRRLIARAYPAPEPPGTPDDPLPYPYASYRV